MSEIILKGAGVSAGIVVAQVFRYEAIDLRPPQRNADSPEAEVARFNEAVQQADAELVELHQKLEVSIGAEHAEIFQAHRMLLSDPMLADAVKQQIHGGQIVEVAVQNATAELAGMFRQMDDELIAARAADIEDIGRRLLRNLLDVPDTSLSAISQPSIIVADELSPSETATLNPDMALGICLISGGATSHAAILSRSLGLPAVVGVGDTLAEIQNGDTIALNGSTGDVILEPSFETVKTFTTMAEQYQKHQLIVQEFSDKSAQTADGKPINVYGNIGDLASAQKAVEDGAAGIGLLRTEFLYLDRTTPPNEETQIKTYKAIFEAMGDRPVVVRTLDIGGDKPPSFIDFPDEMNPFLGWRGIRINIDQPDMLEMQLRAILQAAVGHKVLIMYPMIESLYTLRRANKILEKAKAALSEGNRLYNEETPIGIMVETPAAAVALDLYLDECDFFSIGTNDLVQYTLAVDRGNQHISHYYEPFNPAVLRLIKQVIQTGKHAGKSVSICGELAGTPMAIPLLLGMGLQTFSMTSTLIPQAKWLLHQFSMSEAQQLADHVLSLSTAEAVRLALAEALTKRDIII